MTTTLSKGATTSITLPAGEQLTVTAAALSTGSVWPFSERLGDTAGVSELAAGTSVVLGPFATVKRYQIAATLGSITYDAAQVDFPTASEALAAALAAAAAAALLAHVPVSGTVGDVKEYIGAGAPVDGAAGTGFGVAGIGSRYTDTTAGNLYVNAGTKAVPVWKLVTRAA
jgi:hypothetical protein